MQSGAQIDELVGRSRRQSLGHDETRYWAWRGATVPPVPPQLIPTRSGPLAVTTYAPHGFLIDSPAIRNTSPSNTIENKQPGSFLIGSNFAILRPSISQFEGGAPRPTAYYSRTADFHLRCPCASVARGGKIQCCGTRRTDSVRHS